jgi:hypothetical protein
MKIKINNNVGVMSDPSFKFFEKKYRDLEEKCFKSIIKFYQQNKMRNGLLKKDDMNEVL